MLRYVRCWTLSLVFDLLDKYRCMLEPILRCLCLCCPRWGGWCWHKFAEGERSEQSTFWRWDISAHGNYGTVIVIHAVYCYLCVVSTWMDQDFVERFDLYFDSCLWLLSVQVFWDVMLWHWASGSRCSASMLWLCLCCLAVQIGCWRWRQYVSLTQEPLIQRHSVTSDETWMLAYFGDKTWHLTLMAVCLFAETNRWTPPFGDTFHCRHVLTAFTSLAIC
jgi:hypothetical protein